MADVAAYPFSALEKSGYLVIPSFLSSQQIEALRKDYEAAERPPNDNYNLRFMSEKVLDLLEERLRWIADEAERNTSIRVNTFGEGFPGVQGGIYFATEGGQAFPWHQDHESFYAVQDHYHYFNCYIPIIKPTRERSNLCVVPFDALQARSPDVFQRVKTIGATRYVVEGGKTFIHDDNAGGLHGVLDYDIAELAVTPELAAGDLLLLRGDVIHQTQDSSTVRVSASIRLMNKDTPLTLRHLLRFGRVKWQMMLKNRSTYTHLLRAFRKSRASSIALERVLVAKGVTRDEGTRFWAFAAELLWALLRR